MMSGWKTWLAAGAMLVLAVLEYMDGKVDTALYRAAEALALVGLGHKLDKIKGEI